MNLSNHYLGAVLLILYFLLIFDIFKEFDQGVYKILFTSKYDTLKIILTKVVFSIFLLIGFIGLIVLLFGVNTMIFVVWEIRNIHFQWEIIYIWKVRY